MSEISPMRGSRSRPGFHCTSCCGRTRAHDKPNEEELEHDDSCECFKCKIKSIGFGKVPGGYKDDKD